MPFLRAGHRDKLAALLASSSTPKSVSPNSKINSLMGDGRSPRAVVEVPADKACPDTGTTPLIAAAKAGACGCISLLIEKGGASVNKPNHKVQAYGCSSALPTPSPNPNPTLAPNRPRAGRL